MNSRTLLCIDDLRSHVKSCAALPEREVSNPRSQPATPLRDSATPPPKRLILFRLRSHQIF
jgi:hypothetical protein